MHVCTSVCVYVNYPEIFIEFNNLLLIIDFLVYLLSNHIITCTAIVMYVYIHNADHTNIKKA